MRRSGGQQTFTVTDRSAIAIGWVAASTLAVASALHTLTVDGIFHSYLLAGIDSFYHATRILAAVADLDRFYEWDTRGYSPEGAWIVWPWAYDYGLALLAKAYLASGGSDPVTALVYVPPAWVVVNLGLIVGICIALRLGPVATILAAVFFALLPITQQLHMAGRIDHHFFEWTFVLAVTLTLTTWANSPQSQRAATLCGLSVGLAHAAHNGLFLLQVPVVLYLAIMWLTGRSHPVKACAWFGAALVVSVLSLALGSEPFRQGRFEFYLLSWFHVYLATATALAAVLLAAVRRSMTGAALLATAAAVLGVPLIRQLGAGAEWLVSGALAPVETDALVGLPLDEVLLTYTPLVLASPLALVGAWWVHWRDPGGRFAMLICCSLGFALLVAQFRLNYYGATALVLPLLLLADDFVRARGGSMLWWLPAAIVTLGASSYSVEALRLNDNEVWNPEYGENRELFTGLGRLCEVDPGLVLAHPNQGHYILYHTSCQLIANNSAIAREHYEARATVYRLLAMGTAELLAARPDIRYVVVTRYDGLRANEREAAKALNSGGLHGELLGEDLAGLPDAFVLIATNYVERDGRRLPLTRVFRIESEGATNLL